MGDGVAVDLKALTTFAQQLGKAADDHAKPAPGGGANLVGLSAVMKGSTGAQDPPKDLCVRRNGFLEAQDFSTRHAVMAESVMALLGDAVWGLVSLAAGAETCAVRYSDTDALNAALIERAKAPLDKDKPFAGMVLPLSGTADVPTSAVSGAFTPRNSGERLGAQPIGAAKDAPKPTPVTKTFTPLDKAFVDEVAAKATLLKDGKPLPADAASGRSAKDLGQGFVIGEAPVTLTVEPDQAGMPQVPETVHVPKTGA